MKPRNKYEQRVAELNGYLSEDIAESNANKVKEACKGWDMRHYCYFTVHSNMAEFMVRRLYRVFKFADRSTDHFFFVEIMREFNDGKRKNYFGKQRSMGCYYDTFIYGSDMELRGTYRNYAGYCISDLFELTMTSITEDYDSKRIDCVQIDPNELGRIIKNNPVAENLYKSKDKLFGYLLWRPYAKQICRAITLAKRHGFEFNDATSPIWFDMVRSICYCKKDYHNPVFIAPKGDLMTMHDKFTEMEFRMRRKEYEQRERRKRELRIQREHEEIRKQIEEDKTINEKYIKRRKRFYAMVLTDGLIECRVLRDIKAFEEEGLEMEHCVYRCKYYNKPYSLILSARIGDKRIETIEVNLSNYTIAQCYGKRDHFTMYHDRIKELVNSQMETIKYYNRNRRTIKKSIAV
jgi:hypothetical protein